MTHARESIMSRWSVATVAMTLLAALASVWADDDGAATSPSSLLQPNDVDRHPGIINEWRSYREDELRQLERRREDARTHSKFSAARLQGLTPIAASVRTSTVELLGPERRRLCLGIVIDPAGHILTKASEVAAAGNSLECRFAGGITVHAEVTDMFPPYDLAIVKADASGLSPVSWEIGADEEPGTIVVAVGIDVAPLSFGVLSVKTRSLNPGFLGVVLAPTDQGALVDRILPRSAAMAAGIRAGDLIVEVDEQQIDNRSQLVATVKKFSPGDEVRIKLSRDGAEIELLAMLGSRNAYPALPVVDPNHMMLQRMLVPLSANRTGYPSAFQHDLPLSPDECGGPLINLDGQVIGMNIARSGRIRSLAIPAADLMPLLDAAAEGRFSMPDTEALQQQLAAARQAVSHAEQSLASARTKAANLERAIENLKKYRLPPPAGTEPTNDVVESTEKPSSEHSEDSPPAPDGNGGVKDPQPEP